MTSPNDLIIYAKKLYQFSLTNSLGKELVGYLEQSDYNTTIPKGIPDVPVAHKVGMIPDSLIYNDVGIVYDNSPFAVAIMTKNISYTKSQQVIADLAAIVYKNHKSKVSGKWTYTDKKWYYLDANDTIQTNKWILTSGKWYYVAKDGVMATNTWIRSSGKWDYVVKDGAMLSNSTLLNNDDWYFFNAKGEMLTGWVFIKKKWYYLFKDGNMAVNTTIGDYRIGNDGAWIQ
ncbi:serine hydrolase [Neobacillus vireti]|uniref:serine hydrolase n=1 Tax=Neobacillus vireti TaxID=220686 RepID=UPI000429913C|nr:serine hydrolase [Neobacillus vireti]